MPCAPCSQDVHRLATLTSVTLIISSGPTIVPSIVQNTDTMPASGGVSKPSQRSSSSTRSSRRATLSVGPGGSLSNGSLSPQRVLRTKVLRERSNEGSGYLSSDTNASVGVKAKPVSKG